MTINKTLATALFAILTATGAVSPSMAGTSPIATPFPIPEIPLCIPGWSCKNSSNINAVPSTSPVQQSRFDRFRVEKGVFGGIEMNGKAKK